MSMNFMSPVKKIDELWLYEIPKSRAVNVVKAVRVGNTTLMLSKDGKVYTNRGKSACYILGNGELTTSTMRGLQKLGVISKAQMDAHLAAADSRSEARAKKWAADSIVCDVKKLGITLTKTQVAAIKKAGGTTRLSAKGI